MLAYLDQFEGKNPSWGFWNPEAGKFVACQFSEGITRLGKLRDFFPTPQKQPFLPPFAGTKILCVGRNFKPHAEELGNPLPKEPLWFSKPPSSLLPFQGKVKIPQGFGQIDYEGEMVIVIGRKTRNISEMDAHQAIAGVTLALDITARDLQTKDRQWTRAKGFDTFCPLGPVILPYSPKWLDADLVTTLNGRQVQADKISSMVFSLPKLVSHISECMTLEPGDIILTGTPAGVGAINPGDRLKVTLDGPGFLALDVSVA